MAFRSYDTDVNNTGQVTYTGRPGGVYHNPGRDEGIAAIVLAFLFPILGFILALMSMNRSRRFGWPPEGVARAALWISVLLLVLGLISAFWWSSWANATFLRNLWWI